MEALIGLVGVVIGAAITWAQGWWSARKARVEDARYLAIRVVCVLDKYLDACAEVVGDDGLAMGQRDKDGYLSPQVPTPKPIEYPDDVDWLSVDHDLMYALLSLPNRCEAANGAVSFAMDNSFPPDFEDFFEERERRYIDLGLTTADLAERLRKTYAIPALTRGEWDPAARLREQKVRRAE